MIRELGKKPGETGMTMIFDGQSKLVQIDGYRPILYDLAEDPEEFLIAGVIQPTPVKFGVCRKCYSTRLSSIALPNQQGDKGL